MSDYWKDYYHRPGVKERLREKGIERMIPRYLFIYRYLLEHPCVDCGYGDPLGLDFDHVRGIKLMDISRMVRYTKRFSLSNIQREIDKCDVRCKVCHLKRGMTKKPGPSWYAYLIAMKDAGRGWENGPNWTGKSPWDK